MLLSAVYKDWSREDLMDNIGEWIHKHNQLQEILTGCAEELNVLGSTNSVLMESLETKVPAHILGYHLGDYNCMRESIKMLTAQVVELGAEPVKFRWKFPWLDQGDTDGQST